MIDLKLDGSISDILAMTSEPRMACCKWVTEKCIIKAAETASQTSYLNIERCFYRSLKMQQRQKYILTMFLHFSLSSPAKSGVSLPCLSPGSQVCNEFVSSSN